ncbi:MAG: DNA polymerase III subunit beta [Patescibacteria group bacterium]|nr:DNA polymerase III subunit beta [Patescibacteria group bacterium]
MKIQSLAENFKRGILTAEKIIGKNLTLPILSNILIEAERGRLKVMATNLEIGVVCLLRAKVDKEGKIAVPGRIISGYLNNISDEAKLNMEEKNKTLFLTSEGSRAAVKGVDAKDFPLIPKPQSKALFEIDSQKFQESILKVLICAAVLETRQELTGAFFSFEKNRLVMAATDSFRLAETVVNLTSGDLGVDYQKYIAKNTSVIVPAKTLQEVARSITPESGKTKVFIGESQIFFEVDDIMFVSRIIDGKYPEYKQVIPEDFSSSLLVKREAFLKAVRVASIFSDSKSREVKLRLKGGESKLRVESQSVETGENITEIEAELNMKGESTIAFNSRYLTDALASVSSEEVYVGFNDSFGPVIFREVLEKGKYNGNFLHIVMPIRS